MRMKPAKERSASHRDGYGTGAPITAPPIIVGEDDFVPPHAPDAAANGTALALLPVLETIVPAEFFKPSGSDAIIASLEIEVRRQAAALDISTPTGRKEIASIAFQVAKTKTGLDAARKELNSDMQAQIKAVNGEGTRVWDRLEALQKEVRQPLTDWENADKERIAGHEAAISELDGIRDWCNDNWQRATMEQLLEKITITREFRRDWQEFSKRGVAAHQMAINAATDAHARRETHDNEQAELKRLRAEEIERKERERMQAVADAAAAEERRKADERAAEQARLADIERQRVENERNEAAAKAVQAEAARIASEQRAAAERERLELEARETAARFERERVAAEQEAQRVLEAERVAAEKRQQAAIEAERKRVAEEAERVRKEEEKRAANKAHRAKIEKEILEDIRAAVANGDETPDAAYQFAAMIAGDIFAGHVRHLTINY